MIRDDKVLPDANRLRTIPKPMIKVVEQISRQTGEKHFFAYDQNYRLLATERRLDRITKRVQKLLDKYEWDFSVEKVDGNWTAPLAETTAQANVGTPSEQSTATIPLTNDTLGRDAKRWEVLADLGQMRIMRIPTEEWLQIASHPLEKYPTFKLEQKDSVAAVSNNTGYWNVLRCVILGNIDKQFWKINGHVRAQWWQRNLLPMPETVIATVHRLENESELPALYHAVHGMGVWTTGVEELINTLAENNLEISSPCLKAWPLYEALTIVLDIINRSSGQYALATAETVCRILPAFKVELLLLDGIRPPPTLFAPGVIAAALLILATQPEELGFFAKLANEAGSKNNGRPDPIEALLIEIRSVQEPSQGSLKTQVLLCSKTLAAAEMWGESRRRNEPHWLEKNLAPLRSLEKYKGRLRHILDAVPHSRL